MYVYLSCELPLSNSRGDFPERADILSISRPFIFLEINLYFPNPIPISPHNNSREAEPLIRIILWGLSKVPKLRKVSSINIYLNSSSEVPVERDDIFCHICASYLERACIDI